MTPVYRIAQEFLRIEAIGSRGARSGDPADPLKIEVRVTPSDDLTKYVEQAFTTQTQDAERIYKLQTGTWIFQLNPDYYEDGKQYTVNFRYEMTPQNVNVVRKNFTWNPVNPSPVSEDNCIVYGLLADAAGVPASGQRLVVEQYKNFVTLNHRTAQNTVESDAFGLWNIELPRNQIARIVFGNISKVIVVPRLDRAALVEIPDYQPRARQKDKFGYPFPGGVPRILPCVVPEPCEIKSGDELQTRVITNSQVLLGNDRYILVDSSLGAITVTLPAPANYPVSKTLIVKWKAGNNPVTVNSALGLIDGYSSISFVDLNVAYGFFTDGTDWFVE